MHNASRLLVRILSWFRLSQALLGGHRYYSQFEHQYCPEDFRACGEGTVICKGVCFLSTNRVTIGKCAYIAPGCYIHAGGGFHLGDYSGLGAGTTIITIEHHHAGAESIPFGELRLVKPVYIEDYVWVGANVSILPGVRVGEGAILGLGSVVSRDVPAMAIVMGNPAQVIGHRNQKAFEQLKAQGAARSPAERSDKLWIPPLTRRKYAAILKEFGFDEQDYVAYKRGPGHD
jgi:acetyltransferase-like isoleucine patch superfamily enzyme